MNAGTLTAFLKLDRTGYTTGIDASKKQAQDLEKSLSKMEKSSSSSFSNLASAAKTAAASIGIAAAAGATLSKLVSVTREFDVLNAGLITITGSSEKAATAFSALEKFASTTPYSITQATEAFIKLANYGLTPSEAALTSYGNTAAAMGKSLEQMIEAVADATGGEFERLKEFGIKSKKEGDNVTFTFQGVATTVKNSASEIEKYLMSLGDVNFADSMKNRMDSLDGMMSNLADQWESLFRNISSNGVGEIMQSTVAIGISALEELNATIASGELAAQLQAGVSLWSSWGDSIASSITFVREFFSTEIDAIGDYWGKAIDWLIEAFTYFPQNIKALIGVVVVQFTSSFDLIKTYATGFKEQLTAIFNDDTADAAYSRMQTNISSIKQAREESLDAIMGERNAAIASYEAQQEKASQLRKSYDDAAEAARKNHTDQLAQFAVQKKGLEDTGKATEENTKKVKENGKAYASLSEEFGVLKNTAVNLGSQLKMLEEVRGIDVLSDATKEAVKDAKEAVSETNKLTKANEKLKKTAEELKEEYRTLRLQTGSFFDGFTVGIEDAIESISTMGELGKETFDTLYSSWKDGFYAVITGDFDSLSDVWDSLLSSLLRQFSDFVAGLLLKWAAAEFLNINIGINGGSFSSGSASVLSGIASLFSDGDSSSQSWSGSENAASLASDNSTWKVAGGYAGMAIGAYGVGSGAKDVSEGNYGTGALKMGLGGVSMYKGAVAANLIEPGTATSIAKSWGGAIKGYFSDGAAKEIGTAVGSEMAGAYSAEAYAALAQGQASYGMGSASASLAAAQAAQSGVIAGTNIGTSYVAGQGATSYGTFQAGASSGAGAGGGAMAGLGAVGAFMAIIYALENLGGQEPSIDPSSAMNTFGITPEYLDDFNGKWSTIEGTILDLNESLDQYGVHMQVIGEATYNAQESMLYYTSGLGVLGSAFDESTQTWSEAATGLKLDATQLGASAAAASSLTVAAAADIMSSYTGTATSMSTAVEVANAAANAYQDLAVSESGSTTYAIELQWTLQAMGLSASEAAAAADELIAQMEAEANATSSVADTASTATGMLGGMATAISETASVATTTAESISTLSSSLGGFTSSASSASESLRKAIGSWDEAISSGGSRSASTSEHAAGGIFTQPARIGRHIFGEQGMEALLPLPDGPNTLSNMSKAITRLEQNQSQGYSGPSVIQVNLNADGKTLAKVIMPFVDKQVTAQSRRGVLSERTNF